MPIQGKLRRQADEEGIRSMIRGRLNEDKVQKTILGQSVHCALPQWRCAHKHLSRQADDDTDANRRDKNAQIKWKWHVYMHNCLETIRFISVSIQSNGCDASIHEWTSRNIVYCVCIYITNENTITTFGMCSRAYVHYVSTIIVW